MRAKKKEFSKMMQWRETKTEFRKTLYDHYTIKHEEIKTYLIF